MKLPILSAAALATSVPTFGISSPAVAATPANDAPPTPVISPQSLDQILRSSVPKTITVDPASGTIFKVAVSASAGAVQQSNGRFSDTWWFAPKPSPARSDSVDGAAPATPAITPQLADQLIGNSYPKTVTVDVATGAIREIAV
jgi:hypothetical protein